MDKQAYNVDSDTLKDMDAVSLKEWAKNVEDTILKRIKQDTISVEDLPIMYGISRTSFFLKLKAATGHSPGSLIREQRLQYAYTLLVERPELRVKDVAHAVGYSDIQHFMANFKKKFGITSGHLKDKARAERQSKHAEPFE